MVTMTRWRFLALIVIAAAAILGVLYVIRAPSVHALSGPPQALAALQIAKDAAPAPDVRFTDAMGTAHSITEFRGHYVLLNLWATWCPPCVAELPQLAKLQQAVPGLKVVTVDVERNAAKPAQFLRAHGAGTLPDYRDPQLKALRAVHAFGLPTTLLIDPQGREIARAVGPADWGKPDAIAYFQALTRPKPPAGS
jgi:thiol-disulfide isomerase/thioredoxin